MALDKITFDWDNSFNGTMHAPNGDIKIGVNDLKPYNLLLGALGSCFYATLISITTKMRIDFAGCKLAISGNKRETAPTTLEHVLMELSVEKASDEDKFNKAVLLAAKNCSIHETLEKVANIEIVTTFL